MTKEGKDDEGGITWFQRCWWKLWFIHLLTREEQKETLINICNHLADGGVLSLNTAYRIKRWSLLSHSFGGYIAVLYANLYPDSIEYMIYESPSFDFALSERSLLNAAAKELIKSGNTVLAEDYFKALREITDYKEINRLLLKASNELGTSSNNYMWFGEDK